MTPWHIRHRTGMSQRQREERVALHRIRPRRLARVNIRLAGVARRVDEEGGFGFAQEFSERLKLRVIDLPPGQRTKRNAAPLKFTLEGLTDITRGT